MNDPWGLEQPPIQIGTQPLPPRLARLAEVQTTGVALASQDPYADGFPVAEELPEVQALMREGWCPLDKAPLYCLLPAAWPVEHRAWVPDRLPRISMSGSTDGYWSEIVAVPDDEWHDEYPAELARAAGLPAPPSDRIWLLRSPWPRIPVSVVLHDVVWSGVRRRDGDHVVQVYRVARDVLTWDEQRALDTCPAETRELLEAWAAVGRVGEAASVVIELGLNPADLADALTRTRLDEPTLLAWLSRREIELSAAVEFAGAWHARGLPGNPPAGVHRFVDRDLDELQSWIDAGFNLYAADRLELAGLDTALVWRAAGFDEADTYELLRSDPAVTPQEARAFGDAGPALARRRDWIYYGFTAAQAVDWAAAGLTPYQARIWRACGHGPRDVQPGQRFPPQLLEGRESIGVSRSRGGEMENSEWDEIPDPPGTRGRRARRWVGDDDPRINTD